MQAKDIMSKDVITVTQETPLKEVVKLMIEKKISGIPVVAGDQLLGIVTENDLIVRAKKLDLPTFLPFIGGVIYLEGPDRLEKELKKVTAITAEEVMTTKLHTIKPETSLEEIATIMVERKVNRLPVVEGKRLLGLITRSDVVRAVAPELE